MPSQRSFLHLPVAAVFGDEFRSGARYSNQRPRGSGDWLLIYTNGGAGRIVAGGREHLLRAGDLLLYEPGAAQDYGTAPGVGRWNLLWAHFVAPTDWQGWLSWPQLAPQVRLVRLAEESRGPCREALRRMIRSCRRTGPIGTELAMTALKEAILHGRMSCPDDSPIMPDPRVSKAVAHLTDHFKEPFRLPDLARRCGLSVSRFSHLFRRDAGQTPVQVLEQLRLSHAAHLLRLTSLSVGDVAAECGFDEPFYFSNRFRKRHGMSPRAFRASAGKGQA